MPPEPVILVTGFEPFGPHAANPSEEVAKAVGGRRLGDCVVRHVILPVHHANAAAMVATILAESAPLAVLHLGLAAARARIALERAALNVLDYPLPDNAGYRAADEPCVPGGPAAYFSTLPLGAMLRALLAEGIPAYVSNTAGTYLCNQTLYATLHEIERRGLPTRAGFMHVPLSPPMVAASGLDEPSMDVSVMVRAVNAALGVIAGAARSGGSDGAR